MRGDDFAHVFIFGAVLGLGIGSQRPRQTDGFGLFERLGQTVQFVLAQESFL